MPRSLRPEKSARRKGSSEPGKADLDMTSMIDIVFLLLIFFMCSTQFIRPEGQLHSWLPRDRGIGDIVNEHSPGARITLLRKESTIVCFADEATVPSEDAWNLEDDVQAAQYDFESHHGLTGPDLDAIEEHLRQRKDLYTGVGARGLPVTIDFDDDVPSRYVVDVVNICAALGIDDVTFAIPGDPYE